MASRISAASVGKFLLDAAASSTTTRSQTAGVPVASSPRRWDTSSTASGREAFLTTSTIDSASLIAPIRSSQCWECVVPILPAHGSPLGPSYHIPDARGVPARLYPGVGRDGTG